jgi:hypothetical protein
MSSNDVTGGGSGVRCGPFVLVVAVIGALAACAWPVYREAFIWGLSEWTWDTERLSGWAALSGKLSTVLPLAYPAAALTLGWGAGSARKWLSSWAGAVLVLLWLGRWAAELMYAHASDEGVSALLPVTDLGYWVALMAAIAPAGAAGVLLGSRGRTPPRTEWWRYALSVCCVFLGAGWFLWAWQGETQASVTWHEYVRDFPPSAAAVAGLWFAWPPLLAAIGYLGAIKRFRRGAPWAMGGLTVLLAAATAMMSWRPIYAFGQYLGPYTGSFSPAYVSLWLLAGPLVWRTTAQASAPEPVPDAAP